MKARRLIGAMPRPRILCMDFPDEVVSSLRESFATVEAIQRLNEVEQSEWDLLVTRSEADEAAPHLWMLVFQRELLTRQSCGSVYSPQNSPWNHTVGYYRWSRARTLAIPRNLDPMLLSLAEHALVPKARGRDLHPILTLLQHFGGVHQSLGDPPMITRFLETSDGLPIAGSIMRSEAASQVWCLPAYVGDPSPWVVTACRYWNKYAPDVFPVRRDWRAAPEWATGSEENLRELIADLDMRQAQANLAMDNERISLDDQLNAVSIAADANARRLLTEQGRPLVEAVMSGLQSLGFAVEDMDPEWGSDPKREDLRVTDRADAGWAAIVEVRGYTRGAALNDLVRLHGRFRTLYNLATGNFPTRTWYVVNHHLEDDPPERPLILSNHDAELTAYGEDGVMALDTRMLFRLLIAVERGDVSREDCREKLRNATGRFTPVG